MVKHRIFNADHYLDKFQGFENLLRGYCRLWGKKLGLAIATLDVDTFKKWLVDGESEAKDELMDGLYRCRDISTERGHEDLRTACAECDYDPDPDHDLPVECLALKVRTEKEEAFHLAYDRNAMFYAERFTIRRGRSAQSISGSPKHKKAFASLLAKEFHAHKKSERVLVRSYEEGSSTNFIVYHEKRVQATLVFKGGRTRPKVGSAVFRPLQQDFIRYNRDTGEVEIEARYEGEEDKLRHCFAECFFPDKDFFDGENAAKCLDLGEIAEPSFRLETPEGISAALVLLRFNLPQKGAPSFDVRSKDVLHTLDINRLRKKLKADSIQAAAIKIVFPDDSRGKRVELSGDNKIKFNRATHADDVFQLLRNWELMLIHEDEAEDESAEQPARTHTEPAAHGGGAVATTSRSRTVPKDETGKRLGRKKPR